MMPNIAIIMLMIWKSRSGLMAVSHAARAIVSEREKRSLSTA